MTNKQWQILLNKRTNYLNRSKVRMNNRPDWIVVFPHDAVTQNETKNTDLHLVHNAKQICIQIEYSQSDMESLFYALGYASNIHSDHIHKLYKKTLRIIDNI